MAEAIYKSLEKSNDMKAFSRGLVVLFGEPINPKAEIVLSKHELELNNHVAKGLKGTDLDETTLVLTMTANQKKKVMESYPLFTNVFTIKEFAGEIGDVVDPYGGTLVEYEECFIELARLIKKTVYKLLENDENGGNENDSNWL
jgi:protein-tyrosine phosphatase